MINSQLAITLRLSKHRWSDRFGHVVPVPVCRLHVAWPEGTGEGGEGGAS